MVINSVKNSLLNSCNQYLKLMYYNLREICKKSWFRFWEKKWHWVLKKYLKLVNDTKFMIEWGDEGVDGLIYDLLFYVYYFHCLSILFYIVFIHFSFLFLRLLIFYRKTLKLYTTFNLNKNGFPLKSTIIKLGTIFCQEFTSNNESKMLSKVWSLKRISLLKIYKFEAFKVK